MMDGVICFLIKKIIAKNIRRDMSFLNQKPIIATDEDLKKPWGGGKNGKYFRCYMCGHKFEVGDQYRFVYGENVNLGNLLVCKHCDGDDVLQRWADMHDELKKIKEKYWRFLN
jgi:hypothetical protein